VKLDDLARQATADLHEATRAAEIVPIDSVRWHRRMWLAAPAAATLGALVAVAVMLLPGPSGPPVATTPTTSETTTTTVQTSTTAAVVPWLDPGTSWIRGGLSGVYNDSAELIEDVEFQSIGLLGGGRASAWDGATGFVVVSEQVIWFRDGEAVETDLPVGPLVEVVTVGGVPIVGIDSVDATGTTTWFDLTSGEQVEPPESARTVDGDRYEVDGLAAFIDLPDWTGVQRGEGGEPIPPFDLPELVVTAGDEELLRFPIGSVERPYGLLHDFDGRRVVVSVEPHEPALGPRTVWIIDLECADCTLRVESDGPEWFDLVGTLKREGDLVSPVLP
jgi:hypothetical protein